MQDARCLHGGSFSPIRGSGSCEERPPSLSRSPAPRASRAHAHLVSSEICNTQPPRCQLSITRRSLHESRCLPTPPTMTRSTAGRRAAANFASRLTTPELYRRNRGIGGAAADDAPPATAFRPRLGSTVTLFGREVALGFEHLSVLLVAGVLGGVEVAIGIVVLYLGYLAHERGAARGAGRRRRWRRAAPRRAAAARARRHRRAQALFRPAARGRRRLGHLGGRGGDASRRWPRRRRRPRAARCTARRRACGGAQPAPAPARSPGVAVGGAAARGDARAAAADAAAARRRRRRRRASRVMSVEFN